MRLRHQGAGMYTLVCRCQPGNIIGATDAGEASVDGGEKEKEKIKQSQGPRSVPGGSWGWAEAREPSRFCHCSCKACVRSSLSKLVVDWMQ